jgi:ferritin-like metal-binding protein YciE
MREIDLRAAESLDPQDACINNTDADLLVAAFDERVQQTHGPAVMLDSVVEIARGTGFNGGVDEAVRLLQVRGFEVQWTASGRLAVWRKSAGAP